MINRARIDAAISKIGPFDGKNIPVIRNEVISDATTDMLDNEGMKTAHASLSKAELRRIQTFLQHKLTEALEQEEIHQNER